MDGISGMARCGKLSRLAGRKPGGLGSGFRV